MESELLPEETQVRLENVVLGFTGGSELTETEMFESSFFQL